MDFRLAHCRDRVEVDLVLEVAGVLEAADRVYLPFVVLAELRAGFAAGTRGAENEQVLQRFLRKPGVEALSAGEETPRVYAGLYRQLRRQGTPMPINDLWIASLVVEPTSRSILAIAIFITSRSSFWSAEAEKSEEAELRSDLRKRLADRIGSGAGIDCGDEVLQASRRRPANPPSGSLPADRGEPWTT